jgi:hypothetical protein
MLWGLSASNGELSYTIGTYVYSKILTLSPVGIRFVALNIINTENILSWK